MNSEATKISFFKEEEHLKNIIYSQLTPADSKALNNRVCYFNILSFEKKSIVNAFVNNYNTIMNLHGMIMKSNTSDLDIRSIEIRLQLKKRLLSFYILHVKPHISNMFANINFYITQMYGLLTDEEKLKFIELNNGISFETSIYYWWLPTKPYLIDVAINDIELAVRQYIEGSDNKLKLDLSAMSYPVRVNTSALGDNKTTIPASSASPPLSVAAASCPTSKQEYILKMDAVKALTLMSSQSA